MFPRPTKRSRSNTSDLSATTPAPKRRQPTKKVDRAWLLRLLHACEQNVKIPLTYPETDNDLRLKFNFLRLTIMRCNEQDARDYELSLMTSIRELAAKEGQTVDALINTIMAHSCTHRGVVTTADFPDNSACPHPHNIATQPPIHQLISGAPMHPVSLVYDYEMCNVPLQQNTGHDYPSRTSTIPTQELSRLIHPPAQLSEVYYLQHTRCPQEDVSQLQQCVPQAFTGHPLLRSKMAMELATQGGLV